MSETKQEATQVQLEIVPIFDAAVALRPVMNVAAALQQLAEFQEFVKKYLVADEDYGIIPGTPKPTLYKSGAEKLCDIYGMADDYTMQKEVENWDMVPPLFDYQFKCILTSRRDSRFLGAGFGSCNSWESKYKWRETKRKCPLCQKEAIIKGNEKYGGGWVCWKKRDGCGAKFLDDDKAIVEQKAGREANEDIADIKNTILKMAKKRAKIDAVIAVTRSSGIFTQDMEEHVDEGRDEGSRASAQRVAEEKLRKAKKPQTTAPGEGQKILFWCAPDKFNGHRAVFLNLREFGANLNEVAAEGLRQILKRYLKGDEENGLWVPTGKREGGMDLLIAELEKHAVPTKELRSTE
jgi:hypothetical protein